MLSHSVSETAKISRAFLEACQHGTHPSHRARINIIGHSGAGKTSLTRRLLGQKFQEKEESTDGIETHRIEFDLEVDDKEKHSWLEAHLNITDLVREFSEHVFTRVAEIGGSRPEGASDSAEAESSKHLAVRTETSPPEEHIAAFVVKPGVVEKLEVLHNQKNESEQAAKTEDGKLAKAILRLWDFGGQTEFYATHHMFLDADAINIIVMDISKVLVSEVDPEKDDLTTGIPNTPEEFLCYWLRSVEAKVEEGKIQPTVLIILTHKDLIPSKLCDDYIAIFKKDIHNIIRKNHLASISPDKIFVVDNKADSDGSFNDLRYHLKESLEQQPTWGEDRPIRWLKLEADMKEITDKKTQKPVKHLTLEEVRELSRESGMEREELEACLSYLNSKGDIVWFPDEGVRDVITLDPQWLVDVFKVLITPAKFANKRSFRHDIASLLDSGIMSFSCLEKLWVGNDVRFLAEMLQKFGLILPFGEGEGKNKKFCVPCMLPQKSVHSTDQTVLQEMKQSYRSEHRSSHDALFPLGTFARLVTACSKVWPIREDECLSYTSAIFTISTELLLALTQTHGSSITVSIWCDLAALEQNPLNMVMSTREAISSRLAACRIPAASHCELLCPHWAPGDAHFHMVKVTVKEELASKAAILAHIACGLSPDDTTCICHSRSLNADIFTAGKYDHVLIFVECEAVAKKVCLLLSLLMMIQMISQILNVLVSRHVLFLMMKITIFRNCLYDGLPFSFLL